MTPGNVTARYECNEWWAGLSKLSIGLLGVSGVLTTVNKRKWNDGENIYSLEDSLNITSVRYGVTRKGSYVNLITPTTII